MYDLHIFCRCLKAQRRRRKTSNQTKNVYKRTDGLTRDGPRLNNMTTSIMPPILIRHCALRGDVAVLPTAEPTPTLNPGGAALNRTARTAPTPPRRHDKVRCPRTS